LNVFNQDLNNALGHSTNGTDNDDVRGGSTSNAVGGVDKSTNRFLNLEQLTLNDIEIQKLRLADAQEVVRSEAFDDSINRLANNIDQTLSASELQSRIGIASVVGVVLSASSSIFAQLLRAGSLLASFVTVMPLWRQLDPLPVLFYRKEAKKGKNADPQDQVEDLFVTGANEAGAKK